MNITERTSARTVVNALNLTDAKAPRAVIEAHDKAIKVSAAAQALGAPRGGLAAATWHALDQDKDPAIDPQVQRIVALQSIGGGVIGEEVAATAWGRFREVAQANADAIISAWCTPFDAAVKDLNAAFDRIGPIPLEDTATIMQKGGDIASVWADAKKSAATIDTIVGGWTALAALTKSVSLNRRYMALRIAAVSPSQWEDSGLQDRKVTAWEALTSGLTLSLPTFTEYRARLKAIEDYAESQRSSAEQHALDQQTGRNPNLSLTRVPRDAVTLP